MTAPPPIITPEQARQFVADAQAAFAAAIGEGMARIVDEIQTPERRRADPHGRPSHELAGHHDRTRTARPSR